MVFNVPRNESLASVAPADPDGASRWAGYVANWTAWNHVRTAAALAAAASFSIALGYLSGVFATLRIRSKGDDLPSTAQ